MVQKLSPEEHLKNFNTSTVVTMAPLIHKCFLCLKLNGNTADVRLNCSYELSWQYVASDSRGRCLTVCPNLHTCPCRNVTAAALRL